MHELFICFSGEPIKKKKRTDVQVDRTKELKKKKKIERAMKKLEMAGRKLKPVEEIDNEYLVQKTRE